MKLLICVDDTDDLTKDTSTGKIADKIADAAVSLGCSLDLGVTRHQLLIHEDIDYTSHNSAMCMALETGDVPFDAIREAAEEALLSECAESSDPGLCFCRLDLLSDSDSLVAYGRRAQKQVLTKEIAYALAERIGGTVLSEYGGTGIGVIGALAGVGLRLSGNDGIFRGGKGSKYRGQERTASGWKEELDIPHIFDMDGAELPTDAEVLVDNKLKYTLIENKRVLVAKKQDGHYVFCDKNDIYDGGERILRWSASCGDFAYDNDVEEMYDDTARCCVNCLYRRWIPGGYICQKKGIRY